MIESYSNNLSVNTDEAVTFNNVALKKGCTVGTSGATIQFNKCGVYEVCVNATAVIPSATDAAPANATIELRKDGLKQPQAVSSATAASATAKVPLSLTSFVQVPMSASCDPCSSPTTCSIVNSGAPVTFDNISVLVTKIV